MGSSFAALWPKQLLSLLARGHYRGLQLTGVWLRNNSLTLSSPLLSSPPLTPHSPAPHYLLVVSSGPELSELSKCFLYKYGAQPVTGRGRQRVRAILWSALSVRRLERGICPQLRSGACDQSWHWISWHPPLLISFPDRNKKIMPDPDEGPVHWSLVTPSSEWGQRPNCHFPDKWKLGGSG